VGADKKARTKLDELLKKNGLTSRDLPRIIAESEMEKVAAENAAAEATRAEGWQGPGGDDLGIPRNDIVGVMLRIIENYVWITPEERLATALWCLHSYIFRQFSHTPRFLGISPIEDCGKTTLKACSSLSF
jgi:hypothetical protein